MELLQCPVQRYPWGSTSAIPSLLGLAEDGGPQAELWAGAHPAAPSTIGGRSLADVIADDPVAALGPTVVDRFGPTLPFLAKVLAAAAPLSLQAHPDRARAAKGFAEDEAAGIPIGAANRRYKDANHKPEILVALTPFTALAGFRPVAETVDLLLAFGVAGTTPFDRLEADGPKAVMASLLGERVLGTAAAEALVAGVRRALYDTKADDIEADDTKADDATAGRPAPTDPRHVGRWLARIAEAYPGDPGIAVALLLNLVQLDPGEAVNLRAGNLHAYLEGTGIEVMAASDNVLRGGLTPKHVDVDELLAVLDATPGPPPVVRPTVDGRVQRWSTPDPDFAVIAVGPGDAPVMSDGGPRIVIVTEGTAVLGTMDASLEARKGSVVWIPASDGALWVGGPGRSFVTTVGALS